MRGDLERRWLQECGHLIHVYYLLNANLINIDNLTTLCITYLKQIEKEFKTDQLYICHIIVLFRE